MRDKKLAAEAEACHLSHFGSMVSDGAISSTKGIGSFRAKNNSDKRGSVTVRFAPKATELLRCRECYACSKAPRPAERWADSGPGRARRATCVKRVMPRELCPKSFPPPSFRLAPSAREPLANTVSECEANDQHDCSFQH